MVYDSCVSAHAHIFCPRQLLLSRPLSLSQVAKKAFNFQQWFLAWFCSLSVKNITSLSTTVIMIYWKLSFVWRFSLRLFKTSHTVCNSTVIDAFEWAAQSRTYGYDDGNVCIETFFSFFFILPFHCFVFCSSRNFPILVCQKRLHSKANHILIKI